MSLSQELDEMEHGVAYTLRVTTEPLEAWVKETLRLIRALRRVMAMDAPGTPIYEAVREVIDAEEPQP